MITCRLFNISHRRRQSLPSSRASYPSSRRSNSTSLFFHPRKKNRKTAKTATMNKTSVLCLQELICCTAAANSATKLQTNTSGTQLRKNCVSHVYKERIRSANALQHTHVQNKDRKTQCFASWGRTRVLIVNIIRTAASKHNRIFIGKL